MEQQGRFHTTPRWDVCTYEDKVYSIPLHVQPSKILFYNKGDMLAEETGYRKNSKTMDEELDPVYWTTARRLALDGLH